MKYMLLSRWKSKIGRSVFCAADKWSCVCSKKRKIHGIVRQASKATHIISNSVRFPRLNTVEWIRRRLPTEIPKTKQNALWWMCWFMALLFLERPKPGTHNRRQTKDESPTDIETLNKWMWKRCELKKRKKHDLFKYVISPFGTENSYLTIHSGWRSLRARWSLEMWFWCERRWMFVREVSPSIFRLDKIECDINKCVDTFSLLVAALETRNRLWLVRVAITHFPRLAQQHSLLFLERTSTQLTFLA